MDEICWHGLNQITGPPMFSPSPCAGSPSPWSVSRSFNCLLLNSSSSESKTAGGSASITSGSSASTCSRLKSFTIPGLSFLACFSVIPLKAPGSIEPKRSSSIFAITLFLKPANCSSSISETKSTPRLLNFLGEKPEKASGLILKVLESAVANAENNNSQDIDDLMVKNILIDEGPTGKRHMPRARGRVNEILKRSSHITVIVSDGKEV